MQTHCNPILIVRPARLASETVSVELSDSDATPCPLTEMSKRRLLKAEQTQTRPRRLAGEFFLSDPLLAPQGALYITKPIHRRGA